MILTQEEARKWAEILKGFSEGKRYCFPLYNKNATTVNYVEITDFKVNPQCPTISMTPSRSLNLIDPNMISEVEK